MRLLQRLGARTVEPDSVQLVLATGAATWRQCVLVQVCGELGAVEALGAALPTGWTVDVADTRRHPVSDLIVIVTGLAVAEDRATVARVRAEHPGDPLLAIVAARADSAVVVAALAAGADTCVRTASPPVIASHLLAMQRRRELGRVNQFADAGLTSL